MKKIIATDYDGTFYLNDSDIIKNIQLVNDFRAQNNIFVIATGNNFESFQRTIKKYNIKYDYLILDQGSCIFNSKNRIIESTFIDKEAKSRIYNRIIERTNNIKICSPVSEKAKIDDENITKISTEFLNVEEALEFTKQLNEYLSEKINAYTMIFPKINIVEIISNKTDKCKAIEKIRGLECVAESNVYTVGDGYNDISMVKYFNGYCMKNSVTELKKECSNQINSVSELIQNIMNY